MFSIFTFKVKIMFICFAGEKNNDPNYPDFVLSQFSFLKSPVKVQIKRDVIRYRSEEIKAKRLKPMASRTGSITDIEDT